MTAEIDIADVPPRAEELVALRTACGWGEVSETVAARALGASVLNVSVRRADTPTGMGRVVGDEMPYFYVRDVIVIPSGRDYGIGSLVRERPMARLDGVAPVGATIGLMSADGKEALQGRLGFARRPAQGYGAGMTQFVPGETLRWLMALGRSPTSFLATG